MITDKYRILYLFLTLFIGWISIACTCENYNTLKQEFDENEVVIVGEILDVKPFHYQSDANNTYKVYMKDFTVRVEKKLKGKNLKKIIIIRTGDGDADCGYSFVKGNKYLIFASTHFWYLDDQMKNQKNENNIYTTSLCNLNENMKSEQETVIKIEKY